LTATAEPGGGAAEHSEDPDHPDHGAPQSEARTSPVELLWDLVFAFAVTQVSTLLSANLTWSGLGQSVLVLALVWWAWSAFVWAVNAQLTGTRPVLLTLLPATGFIFIAALALPRAFSYEGTLFAACYAVVRLLHLVLYADASRRGNASWSAIAGFGSTVLIGMVLLLAGSLFSDPVRPVLWTAAVAIDYAGPAWLTRERLRSLQRVAVAHFAERYSLFVIICLGESVVSVGAGALGGPHGSSRHLTAGAVAAAGLSLLITIGMWWVYFAFSAQATERRLREHHDPVLAAADGYSYLHLPIVAGIILLSVGAKLLVRGDPTAALPDSARLALCAGVAIYLLAHLAFELRLGEGRARFRLLGAAALAALYGLGGGASGLAVAVLAAAVLGAVCGCEAWDAHRPTAGLGGS
jgi:low temperature requirement protein LtrA